MAYLALMFCLYFHVSCIDLMQLCSKFVSYHQVRASHVFILGRYRNGVYTGTGLDTDTPYRGHPFQCEGLVTLLQKILKSMAFKSVDFRAFRQ